MSKIDNDKYYTSVELANSCWEKVGTVIGFENISQIVEPSCGDGAFFHYHIKPNFGIDIKPEISGKNIITDDFLTIPLHYKEKRLFIGNPPFGVHNRLTEMFYDRCCEYGDYIAFILPISCYKNDIKLYKFDLVYSEDLGMKHYSDRDLHCCFNIYKRPMCGYFNEKPNYELNEIRIIEHRRKKGNYQTGANKDIASNYVYAMCNWGDGCLGKKVEYIGQYAQEVYFYCNDEAIKEKMIGLLEFDKIRQYASNISSKRVSVMKLYKYFYENIEGLTLKNNNKRQKLF